MDTNDLREVFRRFLHSLNSQLSPIRTFFSFYKADDISESDREALVLPVTIWGT